MKILLKFIVNFKKFNLEIVVFICGASLMILEIIGSRILAPWFGSSVYSWTNLIGVILASLSLGYFLGGKIADKSPKYKILSFIIFLSASYILLVFSIKDLIFALIKTILESLIFGSFLAGLFLIPNFEIKKIIFSCSFFLFFCSLFSLFPERERRFQKIFTIFSIAFFLFSLFLPKNHFFSGRLIFEGGSQYQSILVLEKRKIRILFLDNLPNSAMYLKNNKIFEDELVFDYLKCFNLADYYLPNPKRV
jgi:predicted membrane-bound spermidine synthase